MLALLAQRLAKSGSPFPLTRWHRDPPSHKGLNELTGLWSSLFRPEDEQRVLGTGAAFSSPSLRKAGVKTPEAGEERAEACKSFERQLTPRQGAKSEFSMLLNWGDGSPFNQPNLISPQMAEC